jgi:hypothetical protein
MLQQARLPYVRFETQVRERKDAQGHSVFDNIYYAHITPAGGKDEVVKVAEEWLEDLRNKASVRGPFDSAASEYDQWYTRFKQGFEQFKAGEELTCNGTPLRASMAFTKAEVAQAEAVKIFSIEDLAACNEEAIGRMGMNGRGLKMKAHKLLESAGGDRWRRRTKPCGWNWPNCAPRWTRWSPRAWPSPRRLAARRRPRK